MAVHIVPFTPPMVAAFDQRRKWQFRRIVVPQPDIGAMAGSPWRFKSGDMIAVVERWRPKPGLTIEDVHRPQDVVWAADDLDAALCGEDWLGALALPRSASRFTLLAQTVGYQQVQSITPDECAAEGICRDYYDPTTPIYTLPGTLVAALSPRQAFREVWIDLHGSADAWDANPWVWRTEVTLIRANVDVLTRNPTPARA